MVLSYEIKEYLMPLVAMDAMVVAMFELQRISMVQLAHNHSTDMGFVNDLAKFLNFTKTYK